MQIVSGRVSFNASVVSGVPRVTMIEGHTLGVNVAGAGSVNFNGPNRIRNNGATSEPDPQFRGGVRIGTVSRVQFDGGNEITGNTGIGVFLDFNGANGHGTHVAGTIGGNTYGVAKNVALRSVKVCDAFGNCPGDVTVAGITWVTGNHVKPAVANMSLRFFGDVASINNAVRNSIGAGVTYAVAAGNENDDANNYSPARVAEALTVGATDINDVRASFSNFGPLVDMFAPGVDVLSARIGSDTDALFNSGTSMASPHVAGVAALYLQSNPAAAPATVNSAIVNNASPGRVINPGPGSPNRLLHSLFAVLPPSNAGQPVPKDYDGDGRADVSIKTDDGRWRIDYASNGFGVWDATYPGYGLAESRPAPADYDGDGRADIAVHSITQGRWNIDYAWNGLGSWNFSAGGFGGSANREAPADYDGDGRADIAIKADDQGRFNIDYAWNGFGSWNASYLGYGFADTRPAPGDYDGDGRADFAVKTEDGRWLIDYASNGFGAFDQTIILQS